MQQATYAPCDSLGAKETLSRERRESPRENVEPLVYVDLQPNNGGILLDLTMNGMRVSVARPLKIGKPVCFSFGLPSSTTIEGTGQVAWITESGKSAGICFVNMAESSLTQIGRWLESAPSEAVPEPNDPGHTFREAMETQAGVEGQSVLDQTRPTSFSSVEFTTSSFPDDTTSEDEAKTSVNPSEAAPAEVIDPPTEANDGHSTQSTLEWADEIRMSSLVPVVDEIGQSVHGDATAIAEEILPEALRHNSPATAKIVPHFSIEDSPATIVSQHIEMDALSDPVPLESAPVGTVGGLNDPLPVFTLNVRPEPIASGPHLALRVLFKEFSEIGWALESDWHVAIGILLLVGGFVALWQQPPMLLLGVGLWVAGGLILTGRKRPPADWENPDYGEYP